MDLHSSWLDFILVVSEGLRFTSIQSLLCGWCICHNHPQNHG